MSAQTPWCARPQMLSACALAQTASPSTCARPGSMGSKCASSSRVSWLWISTSRRIWMPGAGTIAAPRATGWHSMKIRLRVAATAGWLAIASTIAPAQDEKPEADGHSIKQDAREVGARIKRDSQEAAAVIKRDSKQAGAAIARGARATGQAVKREAKAAGSAIKKGTRQVG